VAIHNFNGAKINTIRRNGLSVIIRLLLIFVNQRGKRKTGVISPCLVQNCFFCFLIITSPRDFSAKFYFDVLYPGFIIKGEKS